MTFVTLDCQIYCRYCHFVIMLLKKLKSLNVPRVQGRENEVCLEDFVCVNILIYSYRRTARANYF